MTTTTAHPARTHAAAAALLADQATPSVTVYCGPDLEIQADAQQDRQHFTGYLLAVRGPWVVDGEVEERTFYVVGYAVDQAAAVQAVKNLTDGLTNGGYVVWMTGTMPAQDQTPALPEALRRERFLAALAARRAA